MDLFAPRHLLIILAVVLLVFGTKKLKTIGSDLGSAFKGFKQAMREGENEAPAEQTPPSPEAKQIASADKPAEKATTSATDKTAA